MNYMQIKIMHFHEEFTIRFSVIILNYNILLEIFNVVNISLENKVRIKTNATFRN